jgi:hypothetical protein
VVDDFLAQLGLSADADFERLSMRQNPSLDLPSARYLNAVDRLPARGGRDALVDDLLWIIRRDGPQERWFLEKDAVSALREHYRPSNTSLLKEFVPEVDVAVFFGLSRPAWRQGRADGSEQLESALARLHRWPRWNGSRRAGEALLPMLEGGGWQADGNGKGWTCGQTGVIRFRVPLSRHAQQPRDLLLRLEGVYRDGCRHSQVVLNGRSLGNRSLSQGDISVPADRLGREREVELRLEHNATDSSLEALFRLHTMELVRL